MHRVRYDRVRLSYLKNLLHYVNAKAKQATASWQYGKVKQLCNKVLQFGDLFDGRLSFNTNAARENTPLDTIFC